jgi:hypothetical protein
MWKLLSVHCFLISVRKLLCWNILRLPPFPDKSSTDMKSSMEHESMLTFSSYRAVNIHILYYKDHTVNPAQRRNHTSVCTHDTHGHNVQLCNVKYGAYVYHEDLWRLK